MEVRVGYIGKIGSSKYPDPNRNGVEKSVKPVQRVPVRLPKPVRIPPPPSQSNAPRP
jgi:hypothetical protein